MDAKGFVVQSVTMWHMSPGRLAALNLQISSTPHVLDVHTTTVGPQSENTRCALSGKSAAGSIELFGIEMQETKNARCVN
jgi:hypothetical protein